MGNYVNSIQTVVDGKIYQPIRSSVVNAAEKTKSAAVNTTVATSVFVDTQIAPDFLAGTLSFMNSKMKNVTAKYIENNKCINLCLKKQLNFADELDKNYFYGIGHSAIDMGTGVVDDVMKGYQKRISTVINRRPGITSQGAPVYDRAVA